MPSHPILFKGSLPKASDNLQTTFSYLPLEDLYRAQRVCKFWRTTIAWSTHLQERMFIKASHYRHPIPRWHQKFNESLISIRQASFVVNPIVERTWILPDPEDFRIDVDNFTLSPAGYDAEIVKCFGDLPRETPLAFRQRPYLTSSRMSHLNNVGLGQCGPDGMRIPGQLRDIEERNFFHPTQIYLNKSAPLSRSPNGVPTASWLNMLLTQPPVSCIGLKHPVMPTLWIVSTGCGIRIGHVLDALRKMLGVLPRPLQERYLSESSNQIEMMLWFSAAEPEKEGKLAIIPDVNAPVMRPMKAKLRIAVKELEEPVEMCCSGL